MLLEGGGEHGKTGGDVGEGGGGEEKGRKKEERRRKGEEGRRKGIESGRVGEGEKEEGQEIGQTQALEVNPCQARSRLVIIAHPSKTFPL
jgi:hypothetical protein